MTIDQLRQMLKISTAAVFSTILLSGCGNDNSVSIPVRGDLQIQEITALPSAETAADVPTESEITETAAETPTKSEITEMPQIPESEDTTSVSITISAAGDVTLGNHHLQDYYYSFRQTYDQAEDKSYFFENVYDIFAEDDMTIVNLEGPLTLSETLNEGRTYNIKGDPEYVGILTLGNVEAVSFANNHRLDYGEVGSRDTINALENAGVKYAYDATTGIYETHGIRIGFVSVNESSQGTAVEKYLKEGITQLREDAVDLVLACCHWGTEKMNYPEDYQRELGRKCIDWGADLVLGHHPHVLQGIEEYQGKYIVHSLGNFCFGANRNPSDKDTMIFQQTFTFEDGQKLDTQDIRIIPCSISSVSDRNDFRPTPAQGTEAVRIINRINEYSSEFNVQFTEEGLLAEN